MFYREEKQVGEVSVGSHREHGDWDRNGGIRKRQSSLRRDFKKLPGTDTDHFVQKQQTHTS
jgi:hypothetical protein